MDTPAIVMMIIAMVTVWGGLLLAILHLLRHPDETSGDLAHRREHRDL